MEDTNILTIANNIIHGERRNQYGEPEENFARVADYWTKYLKHRKSFVLYPTDVAVMMILFKVARLENWTDVKDTSVDIAGYAALVNEMFTKLNSHHYE